MLPSPLGVSDSHQHPPSPTYLIDPTRECLIALASLGAWYEKRTGRKLHRTVPYGWRHRGVKRADGTIVRLPTVRLGGTYFTSEQAIAWWTAALASKPPERTSVSQERTSLAVGAP